VEIDLDHLAGWTGRAEVTDDLVTPRLVAEFAATFAPHLAPVGAGEAPLGIHWCLSPAIRPMAELGPDGHPARGGFLPPVPLPRRMWAGGLVETLGAIRVGDAVTRRSRVGEVSSKRGRGGALVFVAVHHDYETARGLAIRERHDIVYREARPGGEAPAPGGGPAPAERDWTVETSPTLLFRYSAMTFNGHRIHYDRPYVTAEEGYPGLVVHGPIQATLLLNLAAALGGVAPARFRYRGLSPAIAGAPLRVAARRDGDGIRAWTEAEGGRTCMQAEA
jgi:3-methylfumaryl-CoA hydratase